MALFRNKYDPKKDIANTQRLLREIEQLGELVKHPAWHKIDSVFVDKLKECSSRVMALCTDPRKNETEIKCLLMVAQIIGSIRDTISGMVNSEDQIRDNLRNKVLSMQDMDKPVI
jgi:hypothetical protein